MKAAIGCSVASKPEVTKTTNEPIETSAINAKVISPLDIASMCGIHKAAFMPKSCSACFNYLNYTSAEKRSADLDKLMDDAISEAATRMTPESEKTQYDTIKKPK